ncbi:MAG: LPS assembly lipoprotein LptE [Alphaproteobacteria bacterium]
MTRFFPLLLSVMLLVAGCGFQPLYGTSSTNQAAGNVAGAGRVYIPVLPEHSGQILHSELQHLLGKANADAPYKLTISLHETIEDQGILRNANATRGELRLTAQYQLMGKDGQLIQGGDSRSFSSYNIVQSQFATDNSKETARERSLQQIALDINRQIMIALQKP